MNEQIEHIAKVIHDSDIADINTFPISMSECLARHGARRTGAAMALFKAGYRKQSEGEWLENEDDFWVMCSECGTEFLDDQIGITNTYKYCPYCGAKM
jgi:rubrerythrin